ncbi:MAG TPA: hypothetical protein VNF74_07115 [Terriglobales bacterium]|nr:hypothetical protein [Terriglobales bacterium]
MIEPDHLLDLTRRELALTTRGAPRQANLRRAGSTVYYAVFHALSNEVANAFWRSSGPAWLLFYRALDHGAARKRCEQIGTRFSLAFQNFANAFVELQQFRHSCDYDPSFRVAKTDLAHAIRDAANAIIGLRKSPEGEKTEFLAYVLLGRHR